MNSPAKTDGGEPSRLPTQIDEEDVEHILDLLPPEAQAELVGMIRRSSYHSGPVPSPDALQAYDETLPGLANRLVTMAEKEQEMRREDNRHVNWNDTFKIGASVVVSLALVGAGVYCGVIGEPWLGGVLGTSGVFAGVVQAYLRRPGQDPEA